MSWRTFAPAFFRALFLWISAGRPTHGANPFKFQWSPGWRVRTLHKFSLKRTLHGKFQFQVSFTRPSKFRQNAGIKRTKFHLFTRDIINKNRYVLPFWVNCNWLLLNFVSSFFPFPAQDVSYEWMLWTWWSVALTINIKVQHRVPLLTGVSLGKVTS